MLILLSSHLDDRQLSQSTGTFDGLNEAILSPEPPTKLWGSNTIPKNSYAFSPDTSISLTMAFFLLPHIHMGTNFLLQLMRRDWNARISCDHLGWMNDSVNSLSDFWATGERDFQALFPDVDLESAKDSTFLELGCGVGRLLRSAAKYSKNVVGVDISPVALKVARQLLQDTNNIHYVAGEGDNLKNISESSVDFAYSFAVFQHLPAIVFSKYLSELNRVLKSGGLARIQLFIGEETPTPFEDTAAYRRVPKSRLQEVLEHYGFSLDRVDDLELNIEVPESSPLKPVILSISKTASFSTDISTRHHLLASRREYSAGPDWVGSNAEYSMAVTLGMEHLENGRLEQAKQIFHFAIERFKLPDPVIIEAYKFLHSLQPVGAQTTD